MRQCISLWRHEMYHTPSPSSTHSRFCRTSLSLMWRERVVNSLSCIRIGCTDWKLIGDMYIYAFIMDSHGKGGFTTLIFSLTNLVNPHCFQFYLKISRKVLVIPWRSYVATEKVVWLHIADKRRPTCSLLRIAMENINNVSTEIVLGGVRSVTVKVTVHWTTGRLWRKTLNRKTFIQLGFE